MRKNKMMRLASALLVAVLLSTSVISGTYAKYVTTGSAGDTARVAKWGVTVTDSGVDLFKTAYTTDDTSSSIGPNSVANVSDFLIAPGTSNSAAALLLEGKPEVAVKVEYATTIQLSEWTIDYFPVVFTVNGATYGMEYTYIETAPDTYVKAATNTFTSVPALLAAVQTAANNMSAEYGPNTDLSTTVSYPAITWNWPFETYTYDGANYVINDALDTALGDAAANNANPLKLSIDITTTVTQID